MEFLSPVIGLLVNVTVQVLVYRSFGAFGLLRSVVLGFFAGLAATLAVDAGFLRDPLMPLRDAACFALMDFLTYASLGYCYFHFINLGETARRIRIVREIKESGSGLSINEIIERYGARHVVDIRLGRLLKKGQVVLKDGRYFVGRPSMLVMSRTIVFMKLMLLGKKSEFE
jgi:hypothetical protein